MAVRTDITVDWAASPRIVTVSAPSVEVTIQDLVDTLRAKESQIGQIDDDPIITAAGKEQLGGSVTVGITATLLNALLAFEARSGPTYVQCNVSGGNLVALQADLVTFYTTPISPTAFTQVVVTASSSATTQSLTTIERAAFEGGVWFDPTNSTGKAVSGTAYPAGTPGVPADNLTDLKTIAAFNGFTVINLYSDYTAISGDSLTGFMIDGKSTENNFLSVAGATFTNCSFIHLHLEGPITGTTQAHDCELENISGFAGEAMYCTMETGTIACQAGVRSMFLGCFSGVAGEATPIIDANGSATIIARDHNGGIQINNKTTGSGSIDLNSGQIIIGSTCTAPASLSCRGTGKLTREAGATIALNTRGLTVEDFDVLRIAGESRKRTHQNYGAIYFVDPDNGLNTNSGETRGSAVATIQHAHDNLCITGRNDKITVVTDNVGTAVNEIVTISKNNIHLDTVARDMIFKNQTGTTGGTIFTVTGNGCSISNFLIDGDKNNGTTNADYCIEWSGKFGKLDGVWVKQAVLDNVYVTAGDYLVMDEVEIEKAGRHNVNIEDQNPTNPASGSPREITITGRSNIYITDTGSNIKVSGNSGALGSTTRLIRILSAHLSDAAAYGIDVGANVSGVVTGDNVTFADNTLGDKNILTTSFKDSPEHEMWTRLDLDPNNANTYADDATSIVNDDFNLNRTDNGNGTSTVQRS